MVERAILRLIFEKSDKTEMPEKTFKGQTS